ncbi:MAG: hypothetical protein QNJ81_15890 [Acidimicrobiia bacterium]|nr:hypothetical protein [Acidimicrobiia bacterium]
MLAVVVAGCAQTTDTSADAVESPITFAAISDSVDEAGGPCVDEHYNYIGQSVDGVQVVSVTRL